MCVLFFSIQWSGLLLRLFDEGDGSVLLCVDENGRRENQTKQACGRKRGENVAWREHVCSAVHTAMNIR